MIEVRQNEMIKDSGYDSTDTENTLYDGCEGTIKKCNINENDELLKTQSAESSSNNIHTSSSTNNNEDVFKKYHIEYLKDELIKSENEKFNQRLISNKFDYILIPLFYSLLYTIHLCYSILLANYKLFNYIKNKIEIKKFKLTPKTLSMNVSYLKKIPKHLSFIIQIQPNDHENPQILFNSIKNLIYWSMEVGIPNISFYDYHGFLKQNIEEFVKVFDDEVNFPASSKLNIQFNRSGDKVMSLTINNTYVLNNSEKEKTLIQDFKVNFISYEDGKPHIAKVTTLIAKTMKSKDVNKMSIQDMDNFILQNSGDMVQTVTERDPELIIIYGGDQEYFNLYGFPPWQIRLSEIYYVPGKCNITYSGFINGLFRYSRCEQRVGK
ncbi:Undecaprenyl diphosphate synthase [Neocallimastix sp. 'constans']